VRVYDRKNAPKQIGLPGKRSSAGAILDRPDRPPPQSCPALSALGV
jgi:hypothetical protein